MTKLLTFGQKASAGSWQTWAGCPRTCYLPHTLLLLPSYTGCHLIFFQNVNLPFRFKTLEYAFHHYYCLRSERAPSDFHSETCPACAIELGRLRMLGNRIWEESAYSYVMHINQWGGGNGKVYQKQIMLMAMWETRKLKNAFALILTSAQVPRCLSEIANCPLFLFSWSEWQCSLNRKRWGNSFQRKFLKVCPTLKH